MVSICRYVASKFYPKWNFSASSPTNGDVLLCQERENPATLLCKTTHKRQVFFNQTHEPTLEYMGHCLTRVEFVLGLPESVVDGAEARASAIIWPPS